MSKELDQALAKARSKTPRDIKQFNKHVQDCIDTDLTTVRKSLICHVNASIEHEERLNNLG